MLARLEHEPTGRPVMSTTKIFIDCDPGHDDAIALLYAARHLDLVGVATVYGNSSLQNTTRNALAVLELAGIDVPVAQGCAEPLAQSRLAHASFHGLGGLDGAELPKPKRLPSNAHAVDFLIEMASVNRGELVLAVLGPQTNVALALRREPRLRDWLREISIMGGSGAQGTLMPAPEFNIHCDPEAASTVFNSGVALRLVGLDVTLQTGLDEADIAHLARSGRKVAGVVADLMAFYLARQRERRGLALAPLHDVCAIVPFVDDTVIGYQPAHVDIALNGSDARGTTVCDLSPRQPEPADSARPASNAQLAVVAHHRRLAVQVIETILSYP